MTQNSKLNAICMNFCSELKRFTKKKITKLIFDFFYFYNCNPKIIVGTIRLDTNYLSYTSTTYGLIFRGNIFLKTPKRCIQINFSHIGEKYTKYRKIKLNIVLECTKYTLRNKIRTLYEACLLLLK